ncbi:MAG: T9SS type A sorting domain-containing protein [Saprospiraceae bacterium]|nr:T9SS type A sorting domain-containing protein [Saprospiraceae bacterium]
MEGDILDKIVAYNIYVNQERYTEAQTLLNTFNNEDQNISDFKNVQTIYLNAISQQSRDFQSSSDSLLVRGVCDTNHPLAGYSRSVWEYFTDEFIELNLPGFSINPAPKFVTPHKDILVGEIEVYPNPFNHVLNVTLSHQIESGTLIIYDQLGRSVISQDISSISIKINTSDLIRGLYLLTVIDDKNNILIVEKLIHD